MNGKQIVVMLPCEVYFGPKSNQPSDGGSKVRSKVIFCLEVSRRKSLLNKSFREKNLRFSGEKSLVIMTVKNKSIRRL